MPRSARYRFCRVRTKRPAPTSSTTDSATCATTSGLAGRALAAAVPRAAEVPPTAGRLVCARGTERRHAREQQSRRDGDAGREHQHTYVRRQIENDRALPGRRVGHERGRGPVRERDAGRRTDPGEHQAFDEYLAHHAGAARTQCEPQRELRSARRRARQQELADVRAGDEQHESGDGEQNEQRLRELPSKIREPRRRRADDEPRVFELARELVGQSPLGRGRAGQGVEPGAGLLERNARLQPSEQAEPRRRDLRVDEQSSRSSAAEPAASSPAGRGSATCPPRPRRTPPA